MESPTVWIVGGIDKGNDYTELSKLFPNELRLLFAWEQIILRLWIILRIWLNI